MENYLVIDGGGTFTKYALMDENAAILEKTRFPLPATRTTKRKTITACWTESRSSTGTGSRGSP